MTHPIASGGPAVSAADCATMTLNPIAAALLANQLVDEPLTLNLIIDLAAIFAEI